MQPASLVDFAWDIPAVGARLKMRALERLTDATVVPVKSGARCSDGEQAVTTESGDLSEEQWVAVSAWSTYVLETVSERESLVLAGDQGTIRVEGFVSETTRTLMLSETTEASMGLEDDQCVFEVQISNARVGLCFCC